MAKVPTFPSLDIIAGLKGKLDFYSWKGINIVRKWPVITGHRSTPSEKKNQSAFREFQKDLKNIRGDVRNLWRGCARLANWRWHEVHYRWYRGEHLGSLYALPWTIFPEFKPHPRYNPYFFKVYDACWTVHRGQYNIVFMVDSLQPSLSFYHSSYYPHTREVFRRERGVEKSCGVEPYKYNGGRFFDLDPSYFGEYPPCSWHLTVPHAFAILHENDIMQVISHRGHEFGAPTNKPTVYTYSSGPLFKLVTPPPLDEDSSHTVWRYPLEPVWPTGREWPSKRWSVWYSTYRSWKWPYVPDPEFPYIIWNRTSPFEELPPDTYPYPL
jgi:hypothetical protein